MHLVILKNPRHRQEASVSLLKQMCTFQACNEKRGKQLMKISKRHQQDELDLRV